MGLVECSVIEPDIRLAVPVETLGSTCNTIATKEVQGNKT